MLAQHLRIDQALGATRHVFWVPDFSTYALLVNVSKVIFHL